MPDQVYDPHLYAVQLDKKARFPRRQACGGTVLSGLRTLVPVIEQTGLDPVSVSISMARVNDELDDHCPADSLAADVGPERVVELLDARAHR